MREQYMRSSDGFLILFSMTDASSLQEAARIYRQLDRVSADGAIPPVVLVGTKRDLLAERQVTKEEAQLLASSWDCPLIETSAATRMNVNDAFETLVRTIRKANQPGKPQKSRGREAIARVQHIVSRLLFRRS